MDPKLLHVDWKSDTWLAVLVIIMWSMGRILNPILRAYALVPTSPGALLVTASWVYVALHVGVVGYALYLSVRSLRRGRVLQGPRGWEFLLYVYVVVMTILSLYFVFFQMGYLPPALNDLLPYPFNIEQ